MQLNPDDIQEFKEIYREEFGEELSETDAEQRARQLLTFYEIILRILVKYRPATRRPIDPSSPTSTLESSGDASLPNSHLPQPTDGIDAS